VGFSGFFGVFSLNEMSQDRRRCYAILVCQPRLSGSSPKCRKQDCAQESFAKATEHMPELNIHAAPGESYLQSILFLNRRRSGSNRIQDTSEKSWLR
jgi:hypothetical protein